MSFFYLILIFNVEIKVFSNLEELDLSWNEINDFVVTTEGMIGCKNIFPWIQMKSFFDKLCQVKLLHRF